jgi:hypothetical protein
VTLAVDIFLTPFLLAFHFVKIYLIPGVTSVIFGIIEKFLCALNICNVGFTDIWFPPNDRSIGSKKIQLLPHSLLNLDCWHRGYIYCLFNSCMECLTPSEQKWARVGDIRVSDLEAGEKETDAVKLFSGKIEPNDIGQGSLGDCWLLAALAAVAERNDHIIQGAFLTTTMSDCGHYKIKLYDVFNGAPQWRIFTIDDCIPVKKDTFQPSYTQPHGKEIWVLLLEKAFAKMMGSYQSLEGGHGRVPFRALTGNTPIEYLWKGHKATVCSTEDSEQSYYRSVPELSEEQCFHVFNGALKHNMIICAGSQSPDGHGVDVQAEGIVAGHMYSVLDTCTVNSGSVRLIQLRNPWGSYEWKGAYSDHDANTKGWKPDSGFLIGNSIFAADGVREAKDDGIFWCV